jgi:hypothetical protein
MLGAHKYFSRRTKAPLGLSIAMCGIVTMTKSDNEDRLRPACPLLNVARKDVSYVLSVFGIMVIHLSNLLSTSSVVVNFLPHLTALVRPREMEDGNNKEAEEIIMSAVVKMQCGACNY